MHSDKSALSLHTPNARAKIITIKANLTRSLLMNRRTKNKSIPRITNTTMPKFSIISGEIQSGSEFLEAIS